MADNLKKAIEKNFFEIIPYQVAVIDKNFKLVLINEYFKNFFGDLTGKLCDNPRKNLEIPNNKTKIKEVFETGVQKTLHESIYLKDGSITHFVFNYIPIRNDSRQVEYIIEISFDISESSHWQKEYNLLFERVPCYITVIDRDFNIIRANEKFRDNFGDSRRHCYEAYKHKKHHCQNCPAIETFQDGHEHISTQIGQSITGEKTVYIVTTTPFARDENGVSLVMEISTDITEINKLQDQIRHAHDFYVTLIQNSADGIIALDNKNKTQIFNNAARNILEWEANRKPGLPKLEEMLPKEFFQESQEDGTIIQNLETYVLTSKGKSVPVQFNAIELKNKKKPIGRVGFMQDLKQLRELQNQKIENERKAVQLTFSGLEKSINRILSGIEEKINNFDKNVEKLDNDARNDWKMLKDNYSNAQNLVRTFTKFSKKMEPDFVETNINELVEKACNDYVNSNLVDECDIDLNLSENIDNIAIDRAAIYACMKIFLNHGIESITRRKCGRSIIVRTKEIDNAVIIEINDKSIIYDSKMIKKYFEIQGSEETKLGFLTANMIINQHGGGIDASSSETTGTIYRIKLYRKSIELLQNES